MTFLLSLSESCLVHSISFLPGHGLAHSMGHYQTTFVDRALHFPSKIAMQAFVYTMYYPSRGILMEYCPALGLHQSLTSMGVHIPVIVPNAIGFEYSRTIFPLVEYVGPIIGSATPLSGELGEETQQECGLCQHGLHNFPG